MGTRADLYVGRGPDAEWLGSIGWDGYPDDIDGDVLFAGREDDYRAAVDAFLAKREDATRPEQGWPWPWNDSNTTDYAYAFDDGNVWGSFFGNPWFDARLPEPENNEDDVRLPEPESNKGVGGKLPFPDMSARKNVVLGPRSGLIVVTKKGVI